MSSFWDDYLDSLEEDTPMGDASNGLDDVSAFQQQWQADQQARATQAQQMGPTPIVDPSIGRVVAAGFEPNSDQLHLYPGETAGSTSAAGGGFFGQPYLPGREPRINSGGDSANAIIIDSGDDDNADGFGDGEVEAPEPNDPRIRLGLEPKRANETVTDFKARIKVAAERLGVQSKATLGDFAALGIDPTRYATRKIAEQARQRIRAKHEQEHLSKLNPRSSEYDELYALAWRMEKANRQANNATVKSNILKEVREWQQKTGQPLEPALEPDEDSGDEYYSNELVRGSRGGVLTALTVRSTRYDDRGPPSATGRDKGPRMTSRCKRCIAGKYKCSLLEDGVRPCSRCREKGYDCLRGPPNYGYNPKAKPSRQQSPGGLSMPRNPFAPNPTQVAEPSMLDRPPKDRRGRTPPRRRPEGNNVRVRKSRRSRQRSASPPFELDPSLRNAGRIPLRNRMTQGFMGPNIHGALHPVTGKQVYEQAAEDFNYNLNSMNANANTSQTIDPSVLNQPPADPNAISACAPAANPIYTGNVNPFGARGSGATAGPPPDNMFNPMTVTPLMPYQNPPAGMMPSFEQHNQREVNRRPLQEMQNASQTWNNDSIAPTSGIDPSGNDVSLQQEMADMMDFDMDEILNDPAFSPVVAPASGNNDQVGSPSPLLPPAPNGPPQVTQANWVSRTGNVQMVLDPLWMIPDLPPGGQTGARNPSDQRIRCSEMVTNPLTNKQKACRKNPSKRCEFAMAHPGHDDGHKDLMGQFRYYVCEDCWYANLADCAQLQQDTVTLTKSYVCGACAIVLGSENKVSRGKCPCIDKLNNSWVCKRHLQHGLQQIQAQCAHKTTFLLNEYAGQDVCVRCYDADADMLYGVYACKNCQVFMQEN